MSNYLPIKSTINAINRENLIESNANIKTKSKPVYSLKHVDFTLNSRMAKIELVCTERYRTIERYITQNYQRYPIYSDWKSKSKSITKSIKLTNDVLESLPKHNDPLICMFSTEIVLALKNEELLPSWFIKNRLHDECSIKLDYLHSRKGQLNTESSHITETYYDRLLLIRSNIKDLEVKRDKHDHRVKRCSKKIEKIQQNKKSVVLVILTFFIYYFLNSPKRTVRLCRRKSIYEQASLDIQTNIQDLQQEINALNGKIAIEKQHYEEQTQKITNEVVRLKTALKADINKVRPLVVECPDDSGFIPMKAIGGMKYERIVGCYVIRNRENNKCYIGQSKDVIKRLKQHFRGTVPNNIVFAEDYYSSLPEKKDVLFDVRIIRLQTKDELDATEKEMIQYYDSFSNGYNGTAGNS